MIDAYQTVHDKIWRPSAGPCRDLRRLAAAGAASADETGERHRMRPGASYRRWLERAEAYCGPSRAGWRDQDVLKTRGLRHRLAQAEHKGVARNPRGRLREGEKAP